MSPPLRGAVWALTVAIAWPGCRRQVEAAGAATPAATLPPKLIVATSLGSSAVLTMSPGAREWQASCQIHRPCPPLRPLKRCPAPTACAAPVRTVDAVRLEGAGEGVRTTLRGPLWIGGQVTTTLKGCPPGMCCNQVAAGLSLGVVTLDGLGCGGDASQLCCDAPAFGQIVVATGVLQRSGTAWTLFAPELCLE